MAFRKGALVQPASTLPLCSQTSHVVMHLYFNRRPLNMNQLSLIIDKLTSLSLFDSPLY